MQTFECLGQGHGGGDLIRYTISYRITRNAQTVAAGEGAVIECDEETMRLRSDFGDMWTIPLRQILHLQKADYRIVMGLISGEEVLLYHAGRHYEPLWRDLTRRRNDLMISDALVYEKVKLDGVGARYRLSRREEASEGEGEVRLHEASLLLLSDEEGIVARVPYGLIEEISEGNYFLTITTDCGDTLELSHMGRNMERFRRHLSGALNNLTEQTLDYLRELLPGSNPFSLHQLAQLLRDGRLARKDDIDALNPRFWAGLHERIHCLGRGEEHRFLCALAGTNDLFLGMKRGLMGDLTGDYMWFLVPFAGPTSGPGNALALEVAGGEGGRATYFFRIADRACSPGLSYEDLSELIPTVAAELNRCMLSINFRREPIYLPEHRLTEPPYERYAHAAVNLPALQWLRNRFIGRVIRRSGEQWKDDVMELLTFNTGTTDPKAKWRRGSEKR